MWLSACCSAFAFASFLLFAGGYDSRLEPEDLGTRSTKAYGDRTTKLGTNHLSSVPRHEQGQVVEVFTTHTCIET